MGNVWSVTRHSKLTKWTSNNGWICRCILYVARPPAPFHLPRQHTLARSGAESLGHFGIAPAAPEMSGLERVGRSLTSPSLIISSSPTGRLAGTHATVVSAQAIHVCATVQNTTGWSAWWECVEFRLPAWLAAAGGGGVGI